MYESAREHPWFSRAAVFLVAAVALTALGLGGTARGFEYGILNHAAPELDVGYWIDRDGAPTTYSIGAAQGKWVFLKCFQNWCPGCHKYGFPTLKKVADAFAGDDRVSEWRVVWGDRAFDPLRRTTVDWVMVRQ